MYEQLSPWLAVAAGSTIGGVARYWLTITSARTWGEAFPWGTLGINIAGSFVIGLFFTLTLAHGAMPASANTRLFVMTGICGGFTTFSAFSLQTLQLLNNRDYGAALFYITGSVVLCIAAAALGYWLGVSAKAAPPSAREQAERHVLLTIVPLPETADACLDAANDLAPAFGGVTLAVLHTRADPARLVATSEEVLDGQSAAEFRGAGDKHAAAIRTAVQAWNGRTGRKASLLDLDTDLASALYAHAQAADLVILGKTASPAGPLEREAQAITLFELRRPLLLVPGGWRSTAGKRICIAWKAMPQTVRAIEAAAPLLKAASSVHVLAGFRRDGPDLVQVKNMLKKLEIEALIEPFLIGADPVGQTLLTMAGERSSDLLVTGAYSHSRVAEYILGGVTRYILAQADLPVLMAH